MSTTAEQRRIEALDVALDRELAKGKIMSTTDEREALIHAQRPAFDNDGPPYTLDGMDPLLRGLIVNAVHGAMATKAPPPANHWLTASWEIGRAMTAAVSEPAAPVDARDEALRRLMMWGGMPPAGDFSGTIARGVCDWYEAGMSGELPSLPSWACDAALARQAAAPVEGKS